MSIERFFSRALFVTLLALLAACASNAPKVRVDKDAKADFTRYTTFAWFQPEKEPATSLAAQRIRIAVTTVMQRKGYVENETHPDIRVSYRVATYDRPKESGLRVGLGAGGGSGNIGGGVGVSLPVGKKVQHMAALTLDIVDAARVAQVWTGAYESVIDAPELTEAMAYQLVTEVLAKYPDRVPSPPAP
ncbi:MAG: DUF4136 domain-containing protein [Candidatus Obscuribacterales bacterium]|nr:DUF4136 domain-containing protein [Steroidobacteraceae bacterium]